MLGCGDDPQFLLDCKLYIYGEKRDAIDLTGLYSACSLILWGVGTLLGAVS